MREYATLIDRCGTTIRMRSIEITEFKSAHIPKAASLFCSQYKKQREAVPDLPVTYAEPESITPLISGLSKRTSGIAAFNASRLVGYLVGMCIPKFKSPHNGIYCPEWAHGAAQEGRKDIYRRMYEVIAERWVSDKCYLHCITHLAGDTEAIEAFSMIGFGITTVDAIMNVEPVLTDVPPGLRIESITAEHVEDIMPLSLGLEEHLEMSPSFMPHLERRERDYYTRFLSERDKSIWVAYYGNEAVSYMKCEPSTETRACQVVRAPKVIGISGAYTKPEFRNKGIATAVLSRLLEESGKEGYAKCSVDFESTNRLAMDFWLRYYRPVCFSMTRYVDERISLSECKR